MRVVGAMFQDENIRLAIPFGLITSLRVLLGLQPLKATTYPLRVYVLINFPLSP